MPRKSPTTGAKPHRDEQQSYVAEDIWHWIQEHQNLILLVLTIVVAVTVVYFMRKRAARQTRIQAQQSLSQIITSDQGADESEEQIKRAQSNLSKFEGVEKLAPWFYLNLADAYYVNQRYEQAIQTLKELQNKYPDSLASEYSQQFLRGVQREKSLVQKDLEQRKQRLNERLRRQEQVYEIQDAHQPQNSSSSSSASK